MHFPPVHCGLRVDSVHRVWHRFRKGSGGGPADESEGDHENGLKATKTRKGRSKRRGGGKYGRVSSELEYEEIHYKDEEV